MDSFCHVSSTLAMLNKIRGKNTHLKGLHPNVTRAKRLKNHFFIIIMAHLYIKTGFLIHFLGGLTITTKPNKIRVVALPYLVILRIIYAN